MQKAVQIAKDDRAKRVGISGDDVLRQWVAIARADPNELIELRRPCCRHCHGKNFDYQRTQGEMKAAKADWNVLAQKAKAAGKPIGPFNTEGGEGYDTRKDPHPDCPECFGWGVPVPFPKDTRFLSESARLLYAGIRMAKDSLECKMHDQDAALVNVAKHLGMFNARVEPTSKDREPLQIQMIEIVRPTANHDSETESCPDS